MDEVALSGKYRAYPEYKDSGVEWLGAIPTSWNLSPLKHLCRFKGGGTPNKDNVEYWNGSIPWVSPKDMKSETIISSIDRITLRAVNESSAAIIESRCLLVVVRSGILQHSIPVAINAVPVTLNQDMKALRFHNNFSVDYAKYFVIGHQRSLTLAWGKQGATVESVEHEYLSNCLFPVPSLSEQTQIANFLDHETAKIDALIEKQQRLIALLKEKRQAVISHAVTKGLSRKGESNAPMKDSGVEWLGKVPAHWDVVPLKYLCRFSGGGTPSKDNLAYWTGGHIPWVSPKDMKSFNLSSTIDYVTIAAVNESSTNLIGKGSLLMVVRSGILQRTIPIAINTVPVTMNQDMKALRFGGRMKPLYAANIILGNEARLLQVWSKEGATVESLEHEYLANTLFPVPPQNEQNEINNAIATQVSKFDEMERLAISGIALLKERRTALISAAVTGKIDVRNYQKDGESV